MSVQVMAWVMERAPSSLTGTEQSVAMALANYATDEGGHAYPSIAKLARVTHWDEKTITRALRSLVKQGVIEVEHKATNKRPTMYCFPAFRGDSLTPQEEPRGDSATPLNASWGDSVSVLGGLSDPLTIREPSGTLPNGTDGDSPYALFSAVCEAAGLDPAGFPAREKGKHLAVSKRLLGDGVTSDEARALVGWLKTQAWRTAPVTVFTVEKELGAWRASGRPAARASSPRSQADVNRGGTGKVVV